MRALSGKRRPHAMLLTGQPGVGKTTLVRHLAASLSKRTVRGFTTEEIRVGRERVGFRLENFEGDSVVFAHVEIRSSHRVGKYGVDVAALDRIVESSLTGDRAELYLIDEIGRMECLSTRFVAAVTELLDSESTIVATVGARGGGLIEGVKKRRDVELRTVTRGNRDSLTSEVLGWLRSRFEEIADS